MQESFGVQIKLYSQHNEVHDIKAFYAEKFSFLFSMVTTPMYHKGSKCRSFQVQLLKLLYQKNRVAEICIVTVNKY